MAATAQGRADADAAGRVSLAAMGRDPTAVPQRWQNFAPGVSGAAHDAHVAPASGAAQFEQNFPVPGVPHAGQTIAAPGAGGEEAMR